MRPRRGALQLVVAATGVVLLAIGVGAVASPGPPDTVARLSLPAPDTGSSDTRPVHQHVATRVTLKPRAASPSRSAHQVPIPPRSEVPRFPTPPRIHRPPKRHRLVQAVPAPLPLPPAAPPALDFVISSFNMLGFSHTAAGGNKAAMADGARRTQWAAALLARHHVDIVGLQEFQLPQMRAFDRLTGGAWEVWPGLAVGPRGTENSLAWRTDTWRAVETRTVRIPYFEGHTRPMPYVLLRNPATGLEAWFVNVHNPASTRRFPEQQRWRDVATAKEVELVNTLTRTGRPVFLTGDMNERAEYFCTIAGRTPLVAAHDGTGNGTGDGGGACQPPRARAVDWIFGSPDATFTGYAEDRSPLVQRTTDHPVIVSHVHIQGG